MLARRALIPLSAVSAVFATAVACHPSGGGATESSYAGATLRFVVGYRAGGSFDLHARVVAKYLGRHLPGNPDVIIENMPGAAGAISVKHLTNLTKPDGLTIGLLSATDAAGVIASDLLGHFHLLGSPGPPPQVLLFNGRSGITSVDAWRHTSRPPRFGSSGLPSPLYVMPLVAGAALGLPVRMVTGYTGIGEIRLAFDSGEIDAVSLSVDAYAEAFTSSEVRAVLRFSALPIPGLDAPDAMSIATDAHARDLLDTGIYAMAPLLRFYVAPRGVPPGRLASLREAFAKLWEDPEFLVAARAAGMTIDPVTADVLERLVASVAARPAIVAELRSILEPR